MRWSEKLNGHLECWVYEMSELVKGSEHRCLIEITIGERGSSERKKHLTYRRERGIRESLRSEESREQMRKREGRERKEEK